MTLVGIGYRAELASWLDKRPPGVECLEIVAEHFYGPDGARTLRSLSGTYPLMVHGLGLSLGTPGPLDVRELGLFAWTVERSDPLWVSEHVGFRRTSEMDLGHFNPIAPSLENLEIVAEHVRRVAERCRKRVLVENITTHLRVPGTLAETEFLNRLCERSGCGLLLDVTNLFVNSRNHGFDPFRWLRDIDAERIVQLHVVGYSWEQGRWHDRHRENIQAPVWELIDEALAYASPGAVIIERDENFPDTAELEIELGRLKAAVAFRRKGAVDSPARPA